MRQADTGRIADIVRATLTADFPGTQILDVRVFASDELDDEGFVKITVVFAGDPSDLDARKMAGAVRQVRPKLAEIGEEAFIAAGAVVTKDAPARKVLMGVPARVVRDVPEEELLENQ